MEPLGPVVALYCQQALVRESRANRASRRTDDESAIDPWREQRGGSKSNVRGDFLSNRER